VSSSAATVAFEVAYSGFPYSEAGVVVNVSSPPSTVTNYLADSYYAGFDESTTLSFGRDDNSLFFLESLAIGLAPFGSATSADITVTGYLLSGGPLTQSCRCFCFDGGTVELRSPS
jgi:hypothetical protein